MGGQGDGTLILGEVPGGRISGAETGAPFF